MNRPACSERLAAWRKSQKLSQRALGSAIGVAQGYITNIETGRSAPSRAFLIKLHERFGVRTDYILYGEGVPVDAEASVAQDTVPATGGRRLRPHVAQALSATKDAFARLRASVVRAEPEAVVTPIFRSVRGDIQPTTPRRPKGTTAMGLRAFREVRGMSADDVAFAIGLRRGEIERIEDGTVQPSLNVLAHLRDVLGADLNEIIGVAVPLGRLRMNSPGFGGRVTFGFIDKLGGEDAVRRIVKPVRGTLRKQSIQNWHERRRVPHYAIHQMLAYAAENGIKLSHEDFIPQRVLRDGSTEWPAATLYPASADNFKTVRRSYPA